MEKCCFQLYEVLRLLQTLVYFGHGQSFALFSPRWRETDCFTAGFGGFLLPPGYGSEICWDVLTDMPSVAFESVTPVTDVPAGLFSPAFSNWYWSGEANRVSGFPPEWPAFVFVSATTSMPTVSILLRMTGRLTQIFHPWIPTSPFTSLASARWRWLKSTPLPAWQRNSRSLFACEYGC